MIVLPHTTVDMTYEIEERIRIGVEGMGNEVKNVTLSIGVASCPCNGTTVEAVIHAADAAAYLSKESGKNTTTIKSTS